MPDDDLVTGANHPDLWGAVLAGGKSSRMGVAKAGILLPNGVSMLEHMVRKLLRAVPQVVVSLAHGETVTQSIDDASLHFVRDENTDQGPLAGIEAVLASGHAQRYLIAACDQPLVSANMLARLLAEATTSPCVFRGSDGTIHPFPGVYSKQLLPLIREALKQGRRSVYSLIESQPSTLLDASEAEVELLESFNTPEQLLLLSKRNWTS